MLQDEQRKDGLAELCRRFHLPGELTGCRRIPVGHINTTYQVVLSEGGETRSYLVQKINQTVFRDPVGLMRNLDRITGHLTDREGPGNSLRYYSTAEGSNYVMLDEDGARAVWRVRDYIENAVSFGAAEGDSQVLEGTGRAFGGFLRKLRDFDPSRLTETIPHFHDTAFRMQEFFRIAGEDSLGRARDAEREIEDIRAAGAFAGALFGQIERGRLPVRVTHNDAKTDNVLFDRDTLRPLAVIDLDTCMPGLVCYDFGDIVRSAACQEATGGMPACRLDLERFRACTRGFLSETADFLTGAELDSLAPGAAVVTLELAARFLGDYLAGDQYFRIDYPAHNLDRARRQLSLYQAMMRRMDDMRRIVSECAEKVGDSPCVFP